ncbi:bifunctional lycopene cyclase/phytoene synthase-like protein [Dinothrombium tinctorium]|uniref:15-cis-phytoene synthase n=1 Tax=Dinothrombium tinctorium TaxID=1965070 RepID=A0A443RPE6_9ACAR|nr:bifunctional lycopene cyclase/phytoene synthase-like protein [Dinothrombium tinctorium]
MLVLLSILIPFSYLSTIAYLSTKTGNLQREIYSGEKLLNITSEQILFDALYVKLVVLCCCAFDKSVGVWDTFPEFFDSENPTIFKIYKILIHCFVISECDLPQQAIEDLCCCQKVFENNSRGGFYLSSLCFPYGVRHVKTVVYAFLSISDDIVDTCVKNGKYVDEDKLIKRLNKLNSIKRFIKEVFERPSSIAIVDSKNVNDLIPEINWSSYENEFTMDEISIYRALQRVSFCFHPKPFEEFASGFEWDLNERVPESTQELLEYANYVAASVGEICADIFYSKVVFGYRKSPINDKFFQEIIEKIRTCGNVLQLVNIARDIVVDSENLNRCYIPIEFLKNPCEELNLLLVKQDPWAIGEEKLLKYALKLIDFADSMYEEMDCHDLFYMLPNEVRFPTYALVTIYRQIGESIKRKNRYTTTTKVGKWTKWWTLVKCMYFTNLSSLPFKV